MLVWQSDPYKKWRSFHHGMTAIFLLQRYDSLWDGGDF